MKKIECCECGIVFAISDERYKQLIETGNKFFCPNGHVQWFTDTLKEKLRKMTEDRDWCLNRWHEEQKRSTHLERKICGFLGYIAKLKKKIGNE